MAATLASVPLLLLLAQSERSALPDPAALAGWYALGPDRHVVVTLGPDDGARLLDFEGARFGTLVASGAGLAWRRGDAAPAVAVERDAEGGVAALAWTEPDGTAQRAVRDDAYGWAQEEVRFHSGPERPGADGAPRAPGAREAVELCGLLLLPRGAESRRPGVAIIHGSGDSDRDNVWAFAIASHLALAGNAVLFPDKRGSGESGGDWKAVGFEELAADASAALDVLAARAEVDPERLALVGLSQGGWIAPLAASRDPRVRCAASVSAAAVPVGDQVRHEVEMDVRAGGGDDLAVAIALELLDASFEHGRTGAGFDDYLALVEAAPPALARAFPREPADWRWAWYRRVIAFDPVPLWAELERPVLVVYGAEDERDNVPVAESVRRLEALRAEGRADLDVRVYPESGHALGDPATGWIRRAFLDDLGRWVERHAR